MGQILIRKLDQAVIDKLKARAKARGRSAEAEARDILSKEIEGRARRSLTDLIGSGWHAGRSLEEIDRYLRQLREEWL